MHIEDHDELRKAYRAELENYKFLAPADPKDIALGVALGTAVGLLPVAATAVGFEASGTFLTRFFWSAATWGAQPQNQLMVAEAGAFFAAVVDPNPAAQYSTGAGDEFGNVTKATFRLLGKEALEFLENAKSAIGASPKTNVAFARFTNDVLGKTTDLFANSGKTLDNTVGIPGGETGRLFDIADDIRKYDTEVKILETVAHELGGVKGEVNKMAKGTVTMLSQLKACSSCTDVIKQFNKMFPNVKVNFGSSTKTTFSD